MYYAKLDFFVIVIEVGNKKELPSLVIKTKFEAPDYAVQNMAILENGLGSVLNFGYHYALHDSILEVVRLASTKTDSE